MMDGNMRRRAHAGIAATAALSIAALAACSSGSGSAAADGVTTLTMTVWGGDVDRQTYQDRVDLLEATHPEIKVNLQLIPDGYDQKVQTMIAGGDGPDIMQVAEAVNVYSSKNQLMPLDDYISGSGLDMQERFGNVATKYVYEDQTYAVPDRSGAMIVYYNKDLFDEAGVDYPSADWSQDDALAAMQELTVPGERWGYSGAGWWAQWWSFVYQRGGKIIDDNGMPTANSPAVVEGLQWANDLQYEHHVAPTAADYANMGPDMGGDPAFAGQKVAMNTTGFWGIAGLLESDFDWDIAPMWHGDEQAVSAFGSGLAISRDSEHPDKAFTAIEFLTDAEAQELIIDNAQDVPANIQVQQSDAFLQPSWLPDGKELNMDAFTDSSRFIFTAPLIPEWNEMQAAFDDNLGTFWNEGGDAQTQLDAIQKQLESILQ